MKDFEPKEYRPKKVVKPPRNWGRYRVVGEIFIACVFGGAAGYVTSQLNRPEPQTVVSPEGKFLAEVQDRQIMQAEQISKISRNMSEVISLIKKHDKIIYQLMERTK